MSATQHHCARDFVALGADTEDASAATAIGLLDDNHGIPDGRPQGADHCASDAPAIASSPISTPAR
jgi:hypothetical protein